MKENPEIVSFWETSTAIIKLRKDNLIDFFLKEGAVVGLEEQKETTQSLVIHLGKMRKYPMVVELGEFSQMTPEANRYARSTEADSPVLCVALISHNLAARMMGNFYFVVFKPSFPYRLFPNRKEAIHWALKMYEKKYPNGSEPDQTKIPIVL